METKNGTGWEFHKRTHFDEIVVNYDKVRPEYPAPLFADIFKYTEAEQGIKALEIGAGTGKATFPFLDAELDVTAVEMGANMAEFLTERFKRYSNFNVINAAFEDALLEDNCYDLIYAASAFHWVDSKIGLPKVMRLLKSGGVFALFRHNFVTADVEGFDDELQAVYEKYYFSYYTAKKWIKRPNKKTHSDFIESSQMIDNYGFDDLKKYGFKDVSLEFYDVERIFGADEYIAHCDTMADHRGLPDDKRTALYAGIKEVILKHGGFRREDIVFQLYIGRKP